MDQAPFLRGVSLKCHKMEFPPNLTVQKYHTYNTEYQPVSAGNLPILAKLPKNRWDATLHFWEVVMWENRS
jgi:hypothetical protein